MNMRNSESFTPFILGDLFPSFSSNDPDERGRLPLDPLAQKRCLSLTPLSSSLQSTSPTSMKRITRSHKKQRRVSQRRSQKIRYQHQLNKSVFSPPEDYISKRYLSLHDLTQEMKCVTINESGNENTVPAPKSTQNLYIFPVIRWSSASLKEEIDEEACLSQFHRQASSFIASRERATTQHQHQEHYHGLVRSISSADLSELIDEDRDSMDLTIGIIS